MTDTKWTAGPWGMQTVETSCGVCHKIGPWPHEWRHGKEMSACIYDDYPSPTRGTDAMIANAHLIAAAPDLYEALDMVVRRLSADIEDGSRPDQWSMQALVDKARAAQKKARGES